MLSFPVADWILTFRRDARLNIFCLLLFALLTALPLVDCGSGSSPTTQPPQPPQQDSCPVVTLAESTGPLTGVAPVPSPAPLPPPSPGTTSAGSVCVSTPANNAVVTSPAHVAAAASLVNPIDHMRVYVDGTAEYFTFFNTVDALLWMDPGSHSVEVIATDKSGNDVSTSFTLNVVAPQTMSLSNLQNLPNWAPCGSVFPPGDPRAGQVCAAGAGNAVTTMTENQSTPSLSGSSAMFTMGGNLGFANALYTKFLGGGSNVSHFTYDLYFMIDHPENPQALEFDVNQTINNTRWVFGTECNFKADGKWDVWDAQGGGVGAWVATNVPCVASAFPANTWIHLVWNFERVGNQVHYVSVSVNDQLYNLDIYQQNQLSWTMEDIDVAFQMDIDSVHDPYTVWLDEVTLSAF